MKIQRSFQTLNNIKIKGDGQYVTRSRMYDFYILRKLGLCLENLPST